MTRNVFLFCSLLFFSSPVFACRGIQAEKAREQDASILFEGRPTAYELSNSGPVSGVTIGSLAKVSFEVIKPIRGEQKKQWTAIMRGSRLPKSFSEFTKRFGDTMKVGLRDFTGKIDPAKLPQGYAGSLFIVDAACSMNGEDWLLRKTAQK